MKKTIRLYKKCKLGPSTKLTCKKVSGPNLHIAKKYPVPNYHTTKFKEKQRYSEKMKEKRSTLSAGHKR